MNDALVLSLVPVHWDPSYVFKSRLSGLGREYVRFWGWTTKPRSYGCERGMYLQMGCYV